MRARPVGVVAAALAAGSLAVAACAAFSGSDDGAANQNEAGSAVGSDAKSSEDGTVSPETDAASGDDGESGSPEDASIDVVPLAPATDGAAPSAVDCSMLRFVNVLYCLDFDDHSSGESSLSGYGSVSISETASTRVSTPNSGSFTLGSGTTSGGIQFAAGLIATWTLDFDWLNDQSLPAGTEIANIANGGKTLLLTVLANGGLEVNDSNSVHDHPAPIGWIHVRVTPTQVVVNGQANTIMTGPSPGVSVKLGISPPAAQASTLTTHFDDIVLKSP